MDIDDIFSTARRRRECLPSSELRRHIREQAGLTQQDVAEYLGVTRAAVTRYETGTREPRGQTRDAYQVLLQRLPAGGTR
jgi:transcriptional regulator with XRE-family HTH domain